MLINKYYSMYTLESRTIETDSTINNIYNSPAAYKGFIQPVSGNEQFKEGKAGESATHRLYTNVNVPAVYGDVVTQNSQKYIVLYAIQPTGISGMGIHKEIILGVFE